MEKNKTMFLNKGITLIGLIITIIVALILTAVTVRTIVSGGIKNAARKARTETKIAKDSEAELSGGSVTINDEKYNSIDEYIEKQYGNCEHIWNEWETTQQASCNAVGTEKRTCKICGKIEIIETEKVPHSYYKEGKCVDCEAGISEIIGKTINYKEYISPDGTVFADMPTYTSITNKNGSGDTTYTVANNSGIEWIILGEENGQIKITTKMGVQSTSGGYYNQMRFAAAHGYENFVDELHEIGAIYGKGQYADTSKFEVSKGGTTGGRSFIMQDLGYTFARRATYTYVLEQHEGDEEPKVYRYEAGKTPDGTSSKGGIESKFFYLNIDASNTIDEGEKTWHLLGDEGEPTSITVYKYDYLGSKTLKESVVSAEGESYWIASRAHQYSSEFDYHENTVEFCGMFWNSVHNNASRCVLSESNGNMGVGNWKVRPVVYLESNIELDYDEEIGYTIVE